MQKHIYELEESNESMWDIIEHLEILNLKIYQGNALQIEA